MNTARSMTTAMSTELDDITLNDFEKAASVIYKTLSPTPQISWPLLNERCGCEVWVKHENHLPTGSFKVRGGTWYTEQLAARSPQHPGVIGATRGNHGQSVAFSAARFGIPSTLVVPHGNNPEKNAAMEAYGATLIEHGADFNEALDHALRLSEDQGLDPFPSFHRTLVEGVGTYSIEFLQAVPDLDTVYIPIGMGSGICGMIAARNTLKLKTNIVGVVAANADGYAQSFAAGKVIATDSSNTLADGVAVRVPNEQALEVMLKDVDRIISVSEDEIIQAMRHYFTDTHNLAEGAGAVPLAALLREGKSMRGKKVGLVLSGGNIDKDLMARVLNHHD